MTIELQTKPAFALMGKLGRGPADNGPDWIPPLWQAANRNFEQIQPFIKLDGQGNPMIWGCMSDVSLGFFPWQAEGLYLAGCEVQPDAQPPEGWTKWNIPSFKYAVATCTLADYGEVFNDVLAHYLPENGYALTGAVHERYPAGSGDTLQLYFPINRLLNTTSH